MLRKTKMIGILSALLIGCSVLSFAGCSSETEECSSVISSQEDPLVCYKPVIYFYPEETTAVRVKLSLNGALTCTYPVYHDGWAVTAYPDGRIFDKEGQEYNYLYWEGTNRFDVDFSKGFVVKGEDTAKFLEHALDQLGLTRKEANEFIVYWLPRMQEHPYNLISFQMENYCESAVLDITPKPATVLRVFMAYKALQQPITVEPQDLKQAERKGFTVVEWGGCEVE